MNSYRSKYLKQSFLVYRSEHLKKIETAAIDGDKQLSPEEILKSKEEIYETKFKESLFFF